jgi:two-component system, OmpR family, sensor histidine kinase KdpD
MMPSTDWPRLLSLASHELRTPAGVAAGYVRMLRDGRPHAPTEAQHRLLDLADRSLARVADLLAELSDLARLASGQASFAPTRLVLDEVAAEAAAAFVPRDDSGLRVDLHAAAGPLLVEADRSRILAAVSAALAAVARECPDGARLSMSVAPAPGHEAGQLEASVAVGEAAAMARATDRARPWVPCDLVRSGNGLALAVAAIAVDAFGGRLESLSDERTLVLRLVLPIVG